MDLSGFIQTWLPLSGRFYKVACYILESGPAAEDAVQDLYLRLWNNRDRLSDILNPAAYGISVLKNLCLDRIRHDAALRTEPLDAPSGLALAGPDPPPDRALSDRQTLQKLRQLIRELPEKQRKVLEMRIFEGLEYEEITARTGLSGIHLRVLLSQARKTLRKQMEDWQ